MGKKRVNLADYARLDEPVYDEIPVAEVSVMDNPFEQAKKAIRLEREFISEQDEDPFTKAKREIDIERAQWREGITPVISEYKRTSKFDI